MNYEVFYESKKLILSEEYQGYLIEVREDKEQKLFPWVITKDDFFLTDSISIDGYLPLKNERQSLNDAKKNINIINRLSREINEKEFDNYKKYALELSKKFKHEME